MQRPWGGNAPGCLSNGKEMKRGQRGKFKGQTMGGPVGQGEDLDFYSEEAQEMGRLETCGP